MHSQPKHTDTKKRQPGWLAGLLAGCEQVAPSVRSRRLGCKIRNSSAWRIGLWTPGVRTKQKKTENPLRRRAACARDHAPGAVLSFEPEMEKLAHTRHCPHTLVSSPLSNFRSFSAFFSRVRSHTFGRSVARRGTLYFFLSLFGW